MFSHHNKLRRLLKDLSSQFESRRSWEQVDTLLVEISLLRVDVHRPKKVFFQWNQTKINMTIQRHSYGNTQIQKPV